MKINRFSHEIANNAHLMYICIYIQPLKGCHAWLNLVVYWLCRWFTSIWIKRTFTKKWNLYLTWGIYIPQMMSICFARNLNDQIAIQISKWQYQRWLIYIWRNLSYRKYTCIGRIRQCDDYQKVPNFSLLRFLNSLLYIVHDVLPIYTVFMH